jgi:hypothetical protein
VGFTFVLSFNATAVCIGDRVRGLLFKERLLLKVTAIPLAVDVYCDYARQQKTAILSKLLKMHIQMMVDLKRLRRATYLLL